MRPSQLRNFLECKKAKDKHVRDYDYLVRYDGRYHDGDYYERRGNYDEGSRFTQRLDILEFEGRMHADDFLDWLNTMERVFKYCDPLEHRRVKLVAIRISKNASFWWENLKRQRERNGKKKIQN